MMALFFVGIGAFVLGFVMAVVSAPECSCCDSDYDDTCDQCGSGDCSCAWNLDDQYEEDAKR